MPTNEELDAADKKHEAAIAELRAGLREQRELISKHDQHIKRLDEFMTELRESIATKEDIAGLRSDLRERFARDELMDERLDHYRERLNTLEQDEGERDADKKHAQGMQINWLVVALFVGELAIAGVQLYLMVRHG
jgi:uncharacterized coiled-coil protein SlyX